MQRATLPKIKKGGTHVVDSADGEQAFAAVLPPLGLGRRLSQYCIVMAYIVMAY